MAVIERTDMIRRRIPDIRGWVSKRHSINPAWANISNISRRDIREIYSGNMGIDALRLWIMTNGSKPIRPNDPFLDTVLELCPTAGESMRRILDDRFQEYPPNTTTALTLNESERGTIVATVLKIERERKLGDSGFYLAEKPPILFSSHPCREIPTQPSRRERFANRIQNVVWSRR